MLREHPANVTAPGNAFAPARRCVKHRQYKAIPDVRQLRTLIVERCHAAGHPIDADVFKVHSPYRPEPINRARGLSAGSPAEGVTARAKHRF